MVNYPPAEAQVTRVTNNCVGSGVDDTVAPVRLDTYGFLEKGKKGPRAKKKKKTQEKEEALRNIEKRS